MGVEGSVVLDVGGFVVVAPSQPHHTRANGGHLVVVPPGGRALVSDLLDLNAAVESEEEARGRGSVRCRGRHWQVPLRLRAG